MISNTEQADLMLKAAASLRSATPGVLMSALIRMASAIIGESDSAPPEFHACQCMHVAAKYIQAAQLDGALMEQEIEVLSKIDPGKLASVFPGPKSN